jgi:hypothetical protein
MPKLVWHGKLVPQALMTNVATLLAVVCSIGLLAMAVVVGEWL